MEKYSGIIAMIILLVVLVIFIRYKATHDEEIIEEETKQVEIEKQVYPLDLNDEDALVASLVAAIEMREQIHKNVEIISVRKVG